MAPSRAVKAPSTKKYLKLTEGPRVDIYVGDEKEHFSAPKNLLCYYSRYFDRCFNGSFREAMTQKLEIPEEDREYFKILLAVILKKEPETKFASHVDDSLDAIPYCRDFLQCADKYELAFIASDIVYPILRKIWFKELESACEYGSEVLRGEDIEVFFGLSPRGHLLRDLVVRCAVWCQCGDYDTDRRRLPRRPGWWDLGAGGLRRNYRKQLREVEGFAFQTLNFILRQGRGEYEFLEVAFRGPHDEQGSTNINS